MITRVKRILVGSPLPTTQAIHERLSKVKALAVFSSDALSSVAYATEEILWVLILAGSGALNLAWPIALVIATLLAIVATSYYQTIHAYPAGGGAYIVARENLGTMPSLIAGAALLIDYVLTVAVSVSAGVAAITSAFPALLEHRVALGLTFILFITLVNLRGVRESGAVFAVPTYLFIFSFVILIVSGLIKIVFQGIPPHSTGHIPPTQPLTLFLILRAFASGCTALTGVEAISDGVPAFKPPESDNAGRTLIWMASILISLFLGITFLSRWYGILPNHEETVVSQLARTIFDDSPAYYAIQAATAMILILAANTSYSDFPRLASWMARDRFLPRQLSNLGDRLVFSNGIILLGLLAGTLIVLFHGETHRLIPLYAVGVFLSFTLSQSGMVSRWWRRRGKRWYIYLAINGLGALSTGVVLIIITSTKFIHGAWIVILLILILLFFFRAVKKHYTLIAEQLSLSGLKELPSVKHQKVIIPISGVHRGVVTALRYAQSISDDVTAVYVSIDPEETAKVRAKWQQWGCGVPLIILDSPYRSILGPLLDFIEEIESQKGPDYMCTIVLPEFIPAKWWHHLLHNQTALLLKAALLYSRERGNLLRVVINVPYYLRQ